MQKREIPRSKRKRNLSRLVVARSDITAALNACDLFLGTVKHLGDKLYYPLLCSIVICYARPFTDNKGHGSLPNKWGKFSDPLFQRMHDDLIKARNEIIAHSDIRERAVKIVPPGSSLGDESLKTYGVGVLVSSYYFRLDRFPFIARTIFDLGKRLNEEIEKELEALYGNKELPSEPFDLTFDDDL